MSKGRNGLRHWTIASALGSLLAGGTVAAQARTVPFPRMNVERFTFDPGGNDSLVVDMGALLPEGTTRLGIGVQHVDGAAVTRVGGDNASLRLDSRLLGNFTAAWAPNRWVQLELQLPVIFNQVEGEALASRGFAPVAQNGYAAPLVGLRAGLLRQRDGMPVDLAVSATVGMPMGHPGALGRDDQVPLRPALSVGRDFGPVKVGGGVHAQLRSQENFAFRGVSGSEGDTVNHELGFTLAAAAEVVSGLRGEAGVASDFALGNPGHSTQAWLGARYAAAKGMEVFALGGPAFGGLVGTPRYRAMAGVAFGLGAERGAPDTASMAAPVEEASPVAVVEAPPAIESFVEEPPVAEAEAEAEAEPLPVEVAEPAALPDRDEDGVPDGEDRCPTKAAPGTGHGCPDTDEDSVADHLDNCVFQPGPRENHGCPAYEKQRVLITKEKLQLLEQIAFPSGRATLSPRSKPLLDQVARILFDHPEMERLVIEVHANDSRRADRNLRLSQERAEAVRRYLVSLGVPERRLSAVGRGSEAPLQPATTAAGRAANRRVELLITDAPSVLDQFELLPLE